MVVVIHTHQIHTHTHTHTEGETHDTHTHTHKHTHTQAHTKENNYLPRLLWPWFHHKQGEARINLHRCPPFVFSQRCSSMVSAMMSGSAGYRVRESWLG
jgi:hypothetical protein